MAKKAEVKKVVPKAKLEPETNGHDAEVAAQGKSSATKVWTGAVMLGPITIKVAMFTAARSESIAFSMLHDVCKTNVKQVGYYCPCCVEVEALGAFEHLSGRVLEDYQKVLAKLPRDAKAADIPPAPRPIAYSKGELAVMHIDDANALALAKKVRITENTALVAKENIVKGYELSKGNYVVLTPEEIKAQKPDSSDTIQIEAFVPQGQVNPIHFESSYYLAADEAVKNKSYSVLRAGLIERKVAAVGKICMRQSESIVFIFPHVDGGLIAYTAYLADEVRQIKFQEPAEVSDAETKAVCGFVDAMTTDFDITIYRDSYRGNVMTLIQAKQEGKTLTAEAPKPKPVQSDNLLEMLTASAAVALEQRKKKKAAA